MRLLAVVSLSAIAALAGCAHKAPISVSAWDAFVAPANGVTFQAPSAYKSRNAFGCWERDGRHWREAGWRDFCVDTLAAGTSYSFADTDAPKCNADCVTFDDLRVDTTTIAGSRAVIERARATGGIGAMNRERQILVRMWTSDGSVVVLHGSTGDEAGYDELLAIAATMRPLRNSQPGHISPPT